MSDAVIKILLAVLSAALSAAVTRYVTLRQMKASTPFALFQVRAAAQACARAFSATEARAALPALEGASSFAQRSVGNDHRRDLWLAGAKLIDQALASARSLADSDAMNAPYRAREVQRRGESLMAWLNDFPAA